MMNNILKLLVTFRISNQPDSANMWATFADISAKFDGYMSFFYQNIDDFTI